MVPVKELQAYKATLDGHYKLIVQFLDQYEQGYMPQAAIESFSVKPLIEIQACVSKILKDNKIESVDNAK